MITEEFFNQHHSRSTGRFASGGGFFVAGTSKKTPKLFKTHSENSAYKYRAKRMFMPRNRRGAIFNTVTEEFFNKYHSTKDGKFISGGHVVTGSKLPLRNATTGRLNPTQVRAAFKTPASARQAHKYMGDMNSRTTVGKGAVTTMKTYGGRTIRHESSKGGPARYTSMGPAVRKFVAAHSGPARRAKESNNLSKKWYAKRHAEWKASQA